MLIELVDVLRCPRPHGETWLVASADRTDGRQIVDGTLGCPICRTEYAVRGGVVDFTDGAAQRVAPEPSNAEKALRLAALLDLTDARGYALLCGAWGAHAHALTAISPAPLLLVNPPADVAAAGRVSVILCGGVLPIAPGSARAAAIDPSAGVAPSDVVAAVRSRGRIVAPSTMPSLAGVREIARDEHDWVAEREAAPSAPVTLSVRPR